MLSLAATALIRALNSPCQPSNAAYRFTYIYQTRFLTARNVSSAHLKYRFSPILLSNHPHASVFATEIAHVNAQKAK